MRSRVKLVYEWEDKGCEVCRIYIRLYIRLWVECFLICLILEILVLEKSFILNLKYLFMVKKK